MVDACQAGKWLLYPKLTLAYLMDKLGKIWLSIIFLYNEITSPVTTLYIIMFAPSAQTQAEVGDAKPITYRLVGLVFLWINSKKVLGMKIPKHFLDYFISTNGSKNGGG